MAEKEETEATPDKQKFKKAPRYYGKVLTEAQLKKRYLKYLGQSDDKAFIRSCYTQDPQDERFLNIRRDLGIKDVKRLKALKKAIQKNRKIAVKLIPLAVAAALVTAAVAFFAIFANPLLQNALETGLEAIFDARVNANRFRISLVRFEIAMDSLIIADRDSPMKNLIQMDTIRIKLKPDAIMRGKVYIEEIRTDNIRFGTDRTVSGALPGKPPKVKEPKPEITIPPLVDLQNFDPMALLNSEFDKLQTPKLYNMAMEAFETSAAKWKQEERAVKARLTELQSRAEPFLKINVNDYRVTDLQSIEGIERMVNQVRTLINDVNAMLGSVQSARDDVNRIVTGIQTDIDTARALEQSARDSFAADFNHLGSYLDFGGGAALEVLEPVIWSILTDSAETYLAYAQRALEILDKVKEIQAMLPESAPKPEKEPKFDGRDVVFPSTQYPGFFLGTLVTDVLTPSAWHWGFNLRGVSSDPDLSGIPTTLALSLKEAGDSLQRSAAFNGSADFRSTARERFNAELTGDGFPVNIVAGLQQIGLGGFSGGASFRVNAAGNTDGGFSAGGGISLAQARLRNPTNTFTRAADEAIRQVSTVDLGLRYEHVISGQDRFSVDTNFDEILKNAISGIVNQYLKQAQDALENALRERIEQYIDGRFVSSEELDLLFGALRGDLNAVDELKNVLDSKRAELENRARSMADDARAFAEGAIRQVVDEATRQAQQAVDQVTQQAQQAAEAAALQAQQAAEEAAQQARDQAAQQAQQAVQDALQGRTPSIPTIPGLRR